MYNLKTTVKFEIVRSLKKPSFWIAAILLPVVLVGYIALSGFTGYSAGVAAEEASDVSDLKLAICDEKGAVDEALIGDLEIAKVASKDAGIEDVKSGKYNVFYYIPANFDEEPKIEIYSQTEKASLFANYQATIDALLKQSALEKVGTTDQIILSGQYTVQATSFVDGKEDNVIGKMVIPMVALAIFYILICMFGNRLMMATLEEKENRISEMILTSISSKTLIMGKIISLIAIGFLQVFILAIPLIIGYLNSDKFNIGGMNVREILPNVVFDPWTIFTSVVLLVSSYVLLTGLCVTVGTLVPSAKEASGYMSVVMILVILPLFFIGSFMGMKPDTMTYVLSYFPFSAPIALMMRSAFGTLPPIEAIIGILDIMVASAIVIALAVKIFRFGAIEFSSRVKLRQALQKDWK